MKIIKYDNLKKIVYEILLKLDFSDKNAELIAKHLVDSELYGHSSHGLIRLPIYFQRISEGIINPMAQIDQEDITPTISFVNGNNSLGQLASIFSANIAIEKAKKSGLAAVGLYNIDHTGRLGAYVQLIAEANMVGAYFCNGKSSMKMQAVYGGREPKLSANPFAFSAPRKQLPPIVLDMATTAIAHGKVLDAKAKGVQLQNDCLLDKEGNPTTDPLLYLNGGSLLPFGGNKNPRAYDRGIFIS